MMLISIFVSHLGYIKIYTNYQFTLHFEIYIIFFLLKSSILIRNITWINIFIIAQRKSDTNMHFYYIPFFGVKNLHNSIFFLSPHFMGQNQNTFTAEIGLTI